MNPFFSSLFAHKVTGKERAFCAHFAYINISPQKKIALPALPAPGSKNTSQRKKPIYLHEVTLAATNNRRKTKSSRT
jgi:hypothetical protein